jgi:hypothetical protein
VAIAGQRPESGVRIELERSRSPDAHDPPWNYAGAAHLPDESFPVRATVSADGTVEVELSPSNSGTAPPADLPEKVRLIVRTATKQARSDADAADPGASPVQGAPSWRIVRWRGEK